jgi:Holliday junction resolvasome RuvABC DNA-binding subunit
MSSNKQIKANRALFRIIQDIQKVDPEQSFKINDFCSYICNAVKDKNSAFLNEIRCINNNTYDFRKFLLNRQQFTSIDENCDAIIDYDRECVTLW